MIAKHIVVNKHRGVMAILLFLFLIIVLIDASCALKKNKRQDSNIFVSSISLDEADINMADASKIIDSTWEFIALETKKESIIGRINKIQVFNNSLFILDRRLANKLFRYTKSGEFCCSYGVTGKGPGEIIRYWDFDLTEDTVFILDRTTSKISIFRFSGTFIDEIYPEVRANSLIYINGKFIVQTNDEYELCLIDKDGKVLDKKFKSEEPFSMVRLNALKRVNNKIFYTRQYINNIYSIMVVENKILIKSCYIVDFGKYSINREKYLKLETVNNELGIPRKNIPDNSRFEVDDFVKVDSLVYFNFISNGKILACIFYDNSNNKEIFPYYFDHKTINCKSLFLNITSGESKLYSVVYPENINDMISFNNFTGLNISNDSNPIVVIKD